MPGSLLQRLDEERRSEFWASLALRHCPGMGARLACRVLRAYGSAYEALRRLGRGESRLLPAPVLDCLRSGQWREEALAEWNSAAKLDADVVLWSDEAYPERLRELPDAPVLLYARGDIGLFQGPAIGVVGTRRCSERGRHDANVLAGSLSAAGLVVVSGLALGVDSESHRAALPLPGGTIAVLGTGIDVPYPQANTGLYNEIVRSGLVVSEFAPGTAPLGRNFPIRNRIISGLSLGVLVIEAAKSSGSLITARLALEQNRAVYAVGGGIGEPLSQGCQDLIRRGALPVFSAGDILEDLHGLLAQEGAALAARLTGRERRASAAAQAGRKQGPVGGTPAGRMPERAGHAEERGSLPKPAPKAMPGAVQKTMSSPATEAAGLPEAGNGAETPAAEESGGAAAGRILAALASLGPRDVDGLCEALPLSAAEIGAELILLEVRGAVRRGAGGLYTVK